MKYIKLFEQFVNELVYTDNVLKDKNKSEILRLIVSAFKNANRLNDKILMAKRQKKSDLVNLLKKQFTEANKEYNHLISYGKKKHEITTDEIKEKIKEAQNESTKI